MIEEHGCLDYFVHKETAWKLPNTTLWKAGSNAVELRENLKSAAAKAGTEVKSVLCLPVAFPKGMWAVFGSSEPASESQKVIYEFRLLAEFLKG